MIAHSDSYPDRSTIKINCSDRVMPGMVVRKLSPNLAIPYKTRAKRARDKRGRFIKRKLKPWTPLGIALGLTNRGIDEMEVLIQGPCLVRVHA